MTVPALLSLVFLQVSAGLPVPRPDGPFDVPAGCYVVTSGDADRLQSEGKNYRNAAAAEGYYAAAVLRAHPGNEEAVIEMARRQIAGNPQSYREFCYDQYGVERARLDLRHAPVKP